MSPTTVRLKKEARALAWPWCTVMIAALLPLLPFVHSPGLRSTLFGSTISGFLREGFPLMAFFFGVPLLAALSFGNEFHNRTISLLLSQPVSRMAIWREKLIVVAAAVASAILLFSFVRSSGRLEGPPVWVTAVYLIAVTASAPLGSLLARSTIGGMALSILPFGLVEIVWMYFLGFEHPPASETITAMFIAALVYAGIVLWLGGRTLARLHVTGGPAADDLVMAGPSLMPESLTQWLRCRPAEPFFNLIRKELRLLRTVWLMSLGCCVYLLCMAAFGLLPAADGPAGRLREQDIVLMIPFAALLPLIPILAGCLSLAEERTSGTHSWQLTLPVAVPRLWLIKLLTGLFTSLVCSVVLPGSVVLAAGYISGSPTRFVDPNGVSQWMWVAPLLTVAAFWCACAVNGTVRASILLFPLLFLMTLAGEGGGLLGIELAARTGTLWDLVISWFQVDPQRFMPFWSPIVLTFQWTWWVVPIALLALIQAYHLFQRHPQDSIAWMTRCLVVPVLAACLWTFLLIAGIAATTWNPYGETIRAIDKLPTGAAVQFSAEDLARAAPLSQTTRRWLRGSSISVDPDPVHKGYVAVIHQTSGMDCTLTITHYLGRTIGRKRPVCVEKGQ